MRGGVRATWSMTMLALTLLVSACGGNGSTDGQQPSENPMAGYPKGPTRQFILPGSDNVVQVFGREATAAERKQASSLVQAWLLARVQGEWDAACSYMHERSAASTVEAAESYGNRFETCPKALAQVTRQGEAPRDNIKGGVVSLRIESGQGFAQYHGKEGRDWILSMRREDGIWKVADVAPIERLK